MVGNRFWGWVIYNLFWKNWRAVFSRDREKARRKAQMRQVRLRAASKRVSV
jgi:hypothetical protein